MSRHIFGISMPPLCLDWALWYLPDQGETSDVGLAALAARMCQDGVIGPDPDGGPSSFRAFAKPKHASKGALIADLRALNSLLVQPLLDRLPSLSQLGYPFTTCNGNAMHAVRTQCKVLYVGKYSNPSFGPLGKHLTRHARGTRTARARGGDSAFWPTPTQAHTFPTPGAPRLGILGLIRDTLE